MQESFSFLPTLDGQTLRFGKTHVHGLSESSEMSRDCDVSCQLTSVMVTTSDAEDQSETPDDENVYANVSAVQVPVIM